MDRFLEKYPADNSARRRTDVLRRGMKMSWLTALLSRGGRVLVVGITMLPVLLVVILLSRRSSYVHSWMSSGESQYI